ncbi:unnamed protein product [Adineta ricciae]|uniref:Uncharacterized protein n=1 Tax=Adineta ricciae TaxID=249248 RepID=A0A814WQT5_ADIRI|nr:unnamed protein product [Adineta ricciae]CAF1386300.1 unnamed protein product [Adineta ricciae]
MGNHQNKTLQNVETVAEEEQRFIIDLDEIVQEWIWQTYGNTKLLSRYKREDLLITINWKNVTLNQDDVHLYNSNSSCVSRTLFRTNFDNKTLSEQLYNFTANRSTCSTLKILLKQSLAMSHESPITLHLPKQIMSFQNHIKSEQVIPLGKDMLKEFELPWNVDSQLRIAPRTRLIAKLNVDEEEYSSHFSASIRFSGRIMASIATRQSPSICLKFIVGDIVEIISKARKTNGRLSSMEILNEILPSVGFTIHGRCLFRCGMRQHIVLNQELLELSSSSSSDCGLTPSAPSEYCHLTSSYIKTDDLIRSNPMGYQRL